MDPLSWMQKLLIICQPFQTGTKPYKVVCAFRAWFICLYRPACSYKVIFAILLISLSTPSGSTFRYQWWYWITLKFSFVSLLISKLDCATTTVEGQYCTVTKKLKIPCAYFLKISCIIFPFTSSRILLQLKSKT